MESSLIVSSQLWLKLSYLSSAKFLKSGLKWLIKLWLRSKFYNPFRLNIGPISSRLLKERFKIFKEVKLGVRKETSENDYPFKYNHVINF